MTMTMMNEEKKFGGNDEDDRDDDDDEDSPIRRRCRPRHALVLPRRVPSVQMICRGFVGRGGLGGGGRGGGGKKKTCPFPPPSTWSPSRDAVVVAGRTTNATFSIRDDDGGDDEGKKARCEVAVHVRLQR